MSRIKRLLEALASDKLRDRREATAELQAYLHRPNEVAILHKNALELRAGSPSPVESWHNLVKKICAACEAELEKSQNKKRGPDASLIRLLREAVTNADGDAAGKPRRLLRVARTLFDMCWLGLTSLSPDMPAYKDFALLLRVHLLPVPDYCARGYPETFDALIRHCLSEIERTGLTKESLHTLETLCLLIEGYPGSWTDRETDEDESCAVCMSLGLTAHPRKEHKDPKHACPRPYCRTQLHILEGMTRALPGLAASPLTGIVQNVLGCLTALLGTQALVVDLSYCLTNDIAMAGSDETTFAFLPRLLTSVRTLVASRKKSATIMDSILSLLSVLSKGDALEGDVVTARAWWESIILPLLVSAERSPGTLFEPRDPHARLSARGARWVELAADVLSRHLSLKGQEDDAMEGSTESERKAVLGELVQRAQATPEAWAPLVCTMLQEGLFCDPDCLAELHASVRALLQQLDVLASSAAIWSFRLAAASLQHGSEHGDPGPAQECLGLVTECLEHRSASLNPAVLTEGFAATAFILSKLAAASRTAAGTAAVKICALIESQADGHLHGPKTIIWGHVRAMAEALRAVPMSSVTVKLRQRALSWALRACGRCGGDVVTFAEVACVVAAATGIDTPDATLAYQDAWYASSRPSDSDEEATLLPIHVRLERGHFDKDLPAQSRDSNAGTATVTHASLSSKVILGSKGPWADQATADSTGSVLAAFAMARVMAMCLEAVHDRHSAAQGAADLRDALERQLRACVDGMPVLVSDARPPHPGLLRALGAVASVAVAHLDCDPLLELLSQALGSAESLFASQLHRCREALQSVAAEGEALSQGDAGDASDADEDLGDFGGTLMTQAPRPTQAPKAAPESVVRAEAAAAACAWLADAVAAMGPVDPLRAWEALRRMRHAAGGLPECVAVALRFVPEDACLGALVALSHLEAGAGDHGAGLEGDRGHLPAGVVDACVSELCEVVEGGRNSRHGFVGSDRMLRLMRIATALAAGPVPPSMDTPGQSHSVHTQVSQPQSQSQASNQSHGGAGAGVSPAARLATMIDSVVDLPLRPAVRVAAADAARALLRVVAAAWKASQREDLRVLTDDIGMVLSRLANDPSQAVRVAACDMAPLLATFPDTNVVFRHFQQLPVQMLDAQSWTALCSYGEASANLETADRARIPTSMLALARAAPWAPAFEADCVFQIAAMAVVDRTQQSLARALLGHCASVRGYADPYAYLEPLLPALLHRWAVAAFPVDCLDDAAPLLLSPRALADAPRPLQPLAYHAVPHLLRQGRTEHVRLMGELLDMDEAGLLRLSFPVMISLVMAHEDAKKPLGTALVEHLSEESRQAMYAKHLVDVLAEALRLVRPEGADAVPFADAATVVANIKKKVTNDDPVESFRGPRNALRLVLAVCRPLLAAQDTTRAPDLLPPLAAAAEVIGPLLHAPPVLRQFVGVLCHVLAGGGAVAEDAAGMLASLLDTLPADPDTAATYADLVAGIACAIAEAATRSPGQDAPSPSRLRELAGLLARHCAARQDLRACLAEVPALPAADALRPLREVHGRERDATKPSCAEDMAWLCRNASWLGPTVRKAAADALLVAARGRSAEEIGLKWPLRLLQLAQHRESDPMHQCALQLLASMGPVPAQCIAAPTLSDWDAGVSTGDAGGQGTRSDASPWPRPWLPRTLGILQARLASLDGAVVAAADTCLHGLFSIDGVADLLRSLPPSESRYVSHYADLHDGPSDPGTPTPSDPSTLSAASLWSCDGSDFDSWVCRVVPALLRCAVDDALRMCAPAAKLCPDLARHLGGPALADIATWDCETGEFCAAISAGLEQHVLRPVLQGASGSVGAADASTLGKGLQARRHAVRAVLEWAEHLRRLRQDGLAHAQAVGRRLSCGKWVFDKAARQVSQGRKRPAAAISASGPNRPLPSDAQDLQREGGAAHLLLTGRWSLAMSPVFWDHVYWLDVSYVTMAEAALALHAPMTALLYLEQWEVEEASNHRAEERAVVEALLLRAHRATGEPDGVYGVEAGLDGTSQRELAVHEGDWPAALVLSDVGGRTGSGEAGSGLHAAAALQRMGCGALAAATLRGGVSPGHVADAAWRMGQWGAPPAAPDDAPLLLEAGFSGAVLGAVSALAGGDAEQLGASLALATRVTADALEVDRPEAVASLNALLVQLQMAGILASAWPLRFAPGLARMAETGTEEMHPETFAGLPGSWGGLLLSYEGSEQCVGSEAVGRWPGDASVATARWHIVEEAAGRDGRFWLMEPLLAVQGAALSATRQLNALAELWRRAARHARVAGEHALGQSYLASVRSLLEGPEGPTLDPALRRADAVWRLEEVELTWDRGRRAQAVRVVRGLVADMARDGSCDGQRLGEAMSVAGWWMAEHSMDSPSSILDNYLHGALDHLKGSPGALCEAHWRVAQFADRLHTQHAAAMQAPEYRRKQDVLRRQEEELEHVTDKIRALQAQPVREKAAQDRALSELSRKARELSMLTAAERDARRHMEASLLQYRRSALRASKDALVAGDAHDLPALFKLVRLWLAASADADVNADLASVLPEVASYKFLPLAYQIASRVGGAVLSASGEDSGFQGVVQALVMRVVVQHPHHMLHHLFALANGSRVAGARVPGGSNAGGLEFRVDQEKVAAAKALLSRLVARGDRSARVAGQMEQLIEAYLAIGSLPLRENLKSFPNVPADVVRRTRGLDMVPVPTATVPVDPSGTYAPESLPIFTGFDREVQFVGGVNSPKRVKVSCSDGTRRAQLVKSGGDDLRQDAVMQQMFGLINALLAADGRCRQRALSVRTYRVVPLTPRCGLVEWVNNTLVLTDWLVGRSGGAHARYAPPGGLAYIEGVQKLRDAQVLEQQKGLGHLPAAWADVTSRFPPVLRHFFLERFPAPRDWYVARLTFTRSTAAASVAGYLLGLGDRHSSNILVDMSTAEVVHIDLGIAFEQGRLLPTPERVPFRMTRDIVDGMGPQGVEGPLRRCMEATVGVLRANRDPMLTVIEVFVHDPLYKWALSPSRARRWQQREEQPDAADAEEAAAVAPEALQGTADAARAILRVRQKLEGQDFGDGETRGVEGQVQQLLTEATNPDNLMRMYVGWGAIL